MNSQTNNETKANAGTVRTVRTSCTLANLRPGDYVVELRATVREVGGGPGCVIIEFTDGTASRPYVGTMQCTVDRPVAVSGAGKDGAS